MALTPEDVVNKRFNPTKFREGYDQDEVDDFLDEVVVELRRLNQENEELRQRLVASDARISELQRSVSQAPVQAPLAAAPQPVPVVAPVPVPQPAPAVASVAPEYASQETGSLDQSNTNNLLQLARRLHEEHVREGMEKRDQLIAEGHATAARIVSDAEAAQRPRLEALAQERAGLERRIEELRIFEAEYREQLTSYIQGQLRELEASTPIAAAEQSFEVPEEAPVSPEPVAATEYSAPGATPSAAPEYGTPEYAVPGYTAPAEYPSAAPEYPAPFGQPAAAAPDFSSFPAPQQSDLQQPGVQQPEPPQQPEYPAYTPRPHEYPGLGGN